MTSRAGDLKSVARQHVSANVIPHTSCSIPPPSIRRLETADQPPVWVRRRAAAGLDRRLAADLPPAAGQPAAYRGALRSAPCFHLDGLVTHLDTLIFFEFPLPSSTPIN